MKSREPLQWYDLGLDELSLYVLMKTEVGKARIAAFQHGFWLRGVQP